MKEWKIVPVEPTGDMMDAIKKADISYNAWKGALKFAPTPPQGRPVKPYGWCSQFVERKGVSQWMDCSDADLEKHKKRGAMTQVVYFYVNRPVLYSRPAPPIELESRINLLEEQNAELMKALESAEMALTVFCNGDDWKGTMPGDALVEVRAVLDKMYAQTPR